LHKSNFELSADLHSKTEYTTEGDKNSQIYNENNGYLTKSEISFAGVNYIEIKDSEMDVFDSLTEFIELSRSSNEKH